ncbi:hypothetical protein EVAR_53548_1 [Eumeta japonica]|uniref:Uncharacterized protein n=1 Tax=Eumeta variegata TaxID=151549 RepID=A0A4C1YSZ6_EUMVA|nr:hypothetical protein EVAR_53548_1 [Eumeta japonica]
MFKSERGCARVSIYSLHDDRSPRCYLAAGCGATAATPPLRGWPANSKVVMHLHVKQLLGDIEHVSRGEISNRLRVASTKRRRNCIIYWPVFYEIIFNIIKLSNEFAVGFIYCTYRKSNSNNDGSD